MLSTWKIEIKKGFAGSSHALNRKKDAAFVSKVVLATCRRLLPQKLTCKRRRSKRMAVVVSDKTKRPRRAIVSLTIFAGVQYVLKLKDRNYEHFLKVPRFLFLKSTGKQNKNTVFSVSYSRDSEMSR
jgi:hypothetical protein